jgi:hypothetical protein
MPAFLEISSNLKFPLFKFIGTQIRSKINIGGPSLLMSPIATPPPL